MRGVMEVVESRFKETEIGLIPEDWEVVRLGEVVDVKGGKRLPKGDEFANNPTPYPYIRIVDFKNGSIDTRNLKYLTEKQHILLRRYIITSKDVYISIAGTIGLVGSVPEELNGAHLTENAARLILTTDNLYRPFLVFALQSDMVQVHIKMRATRTSQPKLALTRIKQIPIPLPPLEEQKAIADILSTIQNAIEKTEKVIDATKQLKKSMMKHLFTYGAVAVDEIDKVKLKESEIGLIPEHWGVVRLGEVFKITQKPKNLKLENYNLIPFIPMENIGFGTFNPKYVMKNPKDISSGTYFEKGDLLLAKITPSFENGKQSIVDDIPTEFGIATTEVIPIKQTEKSLISYLFHYLLKPEFRKYLASKMEGSTGRKRLPKEVLFNTLIPLPPLDEQQKIANILTTIDQKIQAEEKKKQALQNLFKTLLQQLMTGKIRVKKAKT